MSNHGYQLLSAYVQQTFQWRNDIYYLIYSSQQSHVVVVVLFPLTDEETNAQTHTASEVWGV